MGKGKISSNWWSRKPSWRRLLSDHWPYVPRRNSSWPSQVSLQHPCLRHSLTLGLLWAFWGQGWLSKQQLQFQFLSFLSRNYQRFLRKFCSEAVWNSHSEECLTVELKRPANGRIYKRSFWGDENVLNLGWLYGDIYSSKLIKFYT